MRTFRDHSDALSAHASFARYLSVWLERFRLGWLEDRESKYGINATAPSAVAFRHMIEDNLNADTVWLAPEMMELTHAAAATFDATEEFVAEDAFIPHGFMVLPEPFFSTDRSEHRICHRAILWRLDLHGCVHVTDFGEARDYAAKTGKPLASRFDDGTLVDESDLPDDPSKVFAYSFDLVSPGELAPTLRITTVSHSADEALTDFADFGEELIGHGVEWSIIHATTIPLKLLNQRREVSGQGDPKATWLTFWRVAQKLMAERIVTSERQHAIRPVRREAQRYGLDRGAPRVIELRRPRGDRDEEGPVREGAVDWTHRWIVGGHWRWQPYPKTGEVKQIWIAPYEKGPQDKPLVIRERVWNWDR